MLHRIIACLGPNGTYGHAVADYCAKMLGDHSTEVRFYGRNEYVLTAVAAGEVPYGVVPIENNSAGLVKEVVSFWLAQPDQRSALLTGSGLRNDRPSRLEVVGQVNLAIRHHLLARKGVESVEELKSVLSHPQALEQCTVTLTKIGITPERRRPVASTAAAAALVAETRGSKMAAIASRFCAERYGLKVLRENLQDAGGNTTRFHIVQNPGQALLSGQKAETVAILFWLKNAPAMLHKALGAIVAPSDLNMSSLHSIPLGSNEETAIYCEFEAHANHRVTRAVLTLIAERSTKLVVLGVFPWLGHIAEDEKDSLP